MRAIKKGQLWLSFVSFVSVLSAQRVNLASPSAYTSVAVVAVAVWCVAYHFVLKTSL